MSAKTVVLWRHGRTEWNAIGRLQGQTEVPLDAVGQAQAVTAAVALAKAFPSAELVSSTLGRAVATAQEYAQLTHADIRLDDRLRERSFGDWEGLTGPEIADRWPEGYRAWQLGDDDLGTPTGGESRRTTGLRVAAAVAELAEASHQDTLIIVSHGAAITAAITMMLGHDPGIWRGITGLDNTHWSVLRKSKPGVEPSWRLVSHNVGA